MTKLIASKEEGFLQSIKDNDIKKVQKYLKDQDINIANNFYFSLRTAAELSFIDILELLFKNKQIKIEVAYKIALIYIPNKDTIKIIHLLLNDKKGFPSQNNNEAIILLDNNNNMESVRLLWSDQRVKDSLEKNNSSLYNKLILQDINDKLKGF